MLVNFTKMHGAGNDYVYVDCTEKELPEMGKISEYVARRHFSVGSDGLICVCRSSCADFRMRMFNADRSEGKMCGNGIRCVAKFVYDRGLTDKTSIRIETLSGIKTVDVRVENGKVASARVAMGEAVLETARIPMKAASAQFIDQPLTVEGRVWRGTAVSMGNPHFVVFCDEPIESLDLPRIGPAFEHHEAFPEGVNTEFVNVIDGNHVKYRVWERGSGETLACGTGSCAVAVACVLLGKAGQRGVPLQVDPIGGVLHDTYMDDGTVILEGPAETAFTGTVDIPDSIL